VSWNHATILLSGKKGRYLWYGRSSGFTKRTTIIGCYTMYAVHIALRGLLRCATRKLRRSMPEGEAFTSCPRIGRAISAVLGQRSLVAPVGAWRPLARLSARASPLFFSLVPTRLGALWLSVGNFWRQMPALLPPHPQARTSCCYSTASFCTLLVLLPERGRLGSTSSLESDPLCIFRSGRFAGNARPGNQAEAIAPTPDEVSKVRSTPTRAA
jgi:hypothetical protein